MTKAKRTVTCSNQWCFSTEQGIQSTKITFQTTMKPSQVNRMILQIWQNYGLLFSKKVKYLKVLILNSDWSRGRWRNVTYSLWCAIISYSVQKPLCTVVPAVPSPFHKKLCVFNLVHIEEVCQELSKKLNKLCGRSLLFLSLVFSDRFH